MSIKALPCINVSVEVFHAAYKGLRKQSTIEMKEDTKISSFVLITSPHTPRLCIYITSRVKIKPSTIQRVYKSCLSNSHCQLLGLLFLSTKLHIIASVDAM